MAQGRKHTGTAYRQSQELKAEVLARDGYRCSRCGCGVGDSCNLHWAMVTQLDVAHIVPWAVSHDSSLANLRALCHPCNMREGIGNASQPVVVDGQYLA